ncbi:sugar ABC transporter substrate-binding protein [Nocardioides caldifontis]|uniref:sugar ABC transporter substrate-binding protein n=1 Tax=Nocardioides caldifontis TaxID=2588938 RepID=UPI0011DF6C65|nr:sugar ABC transporter substrate-binding protein [Nocardioides caldifontis]
MRMQLRRRLLAALMTGALAASVAACGSEEASGSGGSGSGGGSDSVAGKNIGLLYIVKAAEFSNRSAAALKAAAEELDWNLAESDPAGDAQKAITGLEGFVTQRKDAVLSATWEATAIRQPLLSAQQANIPVIDIWGGVQPSDLYSGILATDETEFGRVGSEAFLALLEEGDEVAMLTSSAFTFGAARDKVFEELAGEAGVEVVATHDTDYTNPQADTTKAVTDILAANPDLDGIFADSSLHIPALVPVLEDKGLCGKVKVLGFYGDLPNLAAVRDGCVDIIAEAPVMAQSWTVMDLLAQHFAEGTEIPESFPEGYPFDPAEVVLVTKDNVPSDPEQYVDVEFDYVSYFTERWAEGTYGPDAG